MQEVQQTGRPADCCILPVQYEYVIFVFDVEFRFGFSPSTAKRISMRSASPPPVPRCAVSNAGLAMRARYLGSDGNQTHGVVAVLLSTATILTGCDSTFSTAASVSFFGVDTLAMLSNGRRQARLGQAIDSPGCVAASISDSGLESFFCCRSGCQFSSSICSSIGLRI